MLKACIICGATFETGRGPRISCSAKCRAERTEQKIREHQAKYPERLRATQRQYREKNRVRINREHRKRYWRLHAEIREWTRAWCAANRERINRLARENRARDPERHRRKRNEYNDIHRAHVTKLNTQWRGRRYAESAFAYTVLEKLGIEPWHLPTREKRIAMAYKVLKRLKQGGTDD
jgi:hypothetical protein